MRLLLISVLCACVCAASADVALLKTKARLAGRLAARAKHHKRGVVSHIPTFKLGHDIPVVTHSVVKPVVVTYPPAATVSAVKVPLSHPLLPRYPPHAHRLHHHHFGLKYPHPTKEIVVSKPEHFHHHHHHLAPRPIIPVIPAPPVLPAPSVQVPATPLLPIPQHPLPVPSPPVFIQHAVAPRPVPLAPPPIHVHPRPIFPAVVPSPVAAPAFPYAPQYVIRPGNAVQTSFFATFPRYPISNFGAGVLLGRPQVQQVIYPHQPAVLPQVPVQETFHPTQAVFPHSHIPVQPVEPNVHVHATQPTVHAHAGVSLQPLEPALHLHTIQPTPQLVPTALPVEEAQPAVSLDHAGWSPLQPQDVFQQGINIAQSHEAQPHFTQEQGTQVFEHHDQLFHNQQQFHEQQFHEHQQFNDLQHHQYHEQQEQQFHAQQEQQFHAQQEQQFHAQQEQQFHAQQEQQFHAQQEQQFHAQQEQQFHAQQEQQFHDQQQHQYHDQQQQQFHEHQLQQNIHQQLEQVLHDQQLHQQQLGQEYGAPQDYNHQPNQDYGLPQQYDQGAAEGRSGEGTGEGDEGDQQKFHNHIPLGLQPPIDRPLDHFR